MTARTLVLMLGEPGRWLELIDGVVAARGDGLPEVPLLGDEAVRVVGVVPARDLVVHRIALPDLTDAQARGAARLAMADNSMAAVETLHIAVSDDDDGARTVVALSALRMAEHLATLNAQGFDPDAMLAAPLMVPRPEAGFVRADLGEDIVVRGREAAFADDPVLTPLLTEGEVTTLDRAAIEDAVAAAVANPEVDLRQGVFAKRRRWAVDAAKLRRIGRLAGVLAATLLIVPVVQLIHVSTTASRIEARNIAAAQAALPPGTAVVNPLAQLDERLAALGGAGGGFLPLAGVIAPAANATASIELETMTFDGDGSLSVNARATDPGELAAFETRLAAAGVVITPAPIVSGAGRATRVFTVRTR